MKPLLILIISLLSIISINAQLFHEKLIKENLTFKQIVDRTEIHYDKTNRKRGTGYKQFQRWKYWANRNLDANGRVRSDAKALESYNTFRSNFGENSRMVNGSYDELGPQSAVNTSTWSSALGRVSAIGLDVSNENHIIVGSPTGGIWKTLDLGATWIPLFDDQLLMDVFSLEISNIDPNTYWAGLNGGMLVSVDAGLNWNPVGGINNGFFTIVEMHPTDPNLVFAIDQNSGLVWRSSDGGQNFAINLNHNELLIDLEFHPTNPDIIYVSGNGGNFISTDRGVSFTEITTGPWSGINSNTMMIAVTPAAPTNIYVAEETGGGFNAVYFSADEGLTWTTITDNVCNCQNMFGYKQDEGGGQAPRDMDIVVSPIDPNIIHIAGVETWRTLNLGQNWNQTTFWNRPGQADFVHADVDLLIYDDNRILAGTDGGIYYSTDEAVSWTDITSGLGIRQFYRIGASQTDADRVSGGSQDNGTGILVSGTWYDWLGADGMETFVDFTNSNVIYGTTQNGGLYKSLDGGQTITGIAEPGLEGNWVTPFEQDPFDANTIYTARADVWKSINGGASWSVIHSPGEALPADEMKIAPSDNNYIYTSYQNTLYRSSDGGQNWSMTTMPGVQINYISVNPLDPQRLAVIISGSNTKIMESIDAGATFANITANIPASVGLECVLYENVGNGGLYVGGNPGIYYTADSSNPNWVDSSVDLPKVRISELEIRNQILYVGTFGRGLWKFEFACDLSVVGKACNDFDVCTSNDVFDANCNCFGVFADIDGDGVCDGLDVCPGGDDSIDGDNDGIPNFCDGCAVNCSDVDCDSVCDADDICPNGDDTRDIDGDGIPDFCDPCNDVDYDGVCDEDDVCPGSDNSDVDGDGVPDGCDDCNDLVESPSLNLEIILDDYPIETTWEIKDMSGNLIFSSNGNYGAFSPGDIIQESYCSISPGCYDFIIYDAYGDGICCGFGNGSYKLTDASGSTLVSGGTFGAQETTQFCILGPNCDSSGGDVDGDGICADVDCNDNDISVRLIGTTCNDGDHCTSGDIYDANCNCVGIITNDADNDGVCDLDDLCPGSDDTIDTDSDGIPDACDDCVNYLQHTGNEILMVDRAAVFEIESNHIIPTSSNLSFNAGVSIELTTDFIVEPGAVFEAYIASCTQ